MRQVAETLELSEGAVRKRLSRGREQIKSELGRYVEDALGRLRPRRGFAASVLALLPVGVPIASGGISWGVRGGIGGGVNSGDHEQSPWGWQVPDSEWRLENRRHSSGGYGSGRRGCDVRCRLSRWRRSSRRECAGDCGERRRSAIHRFDRSGRCERSARKRRTPGPATVVGCVRGVTAHNGRGWRLWRFRISRWPRVRSQPDSRRPRACLVEL